MAQGVGNTQAVFFIATPHQGANLPGVAEKILSVVAAGNPIKRWLLRLSPAMDDLKKNNVLLICRNGMARMHRRQVVVTAVPKSKDFRGESEVFAIGGYVSGSSCKRGDRLGAGCTVSRRWHESNPDCAAARAPGDACWEAFGAARCAHRSLSSRLDTTGRTRRLVRVYRNTGHRGGSVGEQCGLWRVWKIPGVRPHTAAGDGPGNVAAVVA